ncbi:hypothetical protein HZC21_05140 [Candidatus Peregrinibacteria bacterium]|nr:hypothetical protein [Candidatus Peregrinibacteria bacterium]
MSEASSPIETGIVLPRDRTRCRPDDVRVSQEIYDDLESTRRTGVVTDVYGNQVTVARGRLGRKAVLAANLVNLDEDAKQKALKDRIQEVARPIADAIIRFFGQKEHNSLSYMLEFATDPFCRETFEFIEDIPIPAIGSQADDELDNPVQSADDLRKNFPYALKQAVERIINIYLRDNLTVKFKGESIWDKKQLAIYFNDAHIDDEKGGLISISFTMEPKKAGE